MKLLSLRATYFGRKSKLLGPNNNNLLDSCKVKQKVLILIERIFTRQRKKYVNIKVHIGILRGPQNFSKYPPYFCPM